MTRLRPERRKAGEWTQISGTGTLGGSGDFTSPSLVIENKYGTSNADFIVDDISVTGSDSGSSFVPPTTGTATAAKAFGDVFETRLSIIGMAPIRGLWNTTDAYISTLRVMALL